MYFFGGEYSLTYIIDRNLKHCGDTKYFGT